MVKVKVAYHDAPCAPHLRPSLPFIATQTQCLTALYHGLACGPDTVSSWYANVHVVYMSLSRHTFRHFCIYHYAWQAINQHHSTDYAHTFPISDPTIWISVSIYLLPSLPLTLPSALLSSLNLPFNPLNIIYLSVMFKSWWEYLGSWSLSKHELISTVFLQLS